MSIWFLKLTLQHTYKQVTKILFSLFWPVQSENKRVLWVAGAMTLPIHLSYSLRQYKLGWYLLQPEGPE